LRKSAQQASKLETRALFAGKADALQRLSDLVERIVAGEN
jgi:hypothetical protein